MNEFCPVSTSFINKSFVFVLHNCTEYGGADGPASHSTLRAYEKNPFYPL